jgi:hypothetical protein
VAGGEEPVTIPPVQPDSASSGADAASPPGEPGRDEVVRAIDALVDECRVQCLWYARPDYYPRSDAERLGVLEAIQERSSLAVFQRAGALKAWLSRHSSDASAAS